MTTRNSNRNLMQTIKWAQSFVRFQPLTIGGQEPALDTANMVMQTMLGAPFCWSWNRSKAEGNTGLAIAKGDYEGVMPATAAADFGFLEKAYIESVPGLEPHELEIVPLVTREYTNQDRPTRVCVLNDNGGTDINLRWSPAADQAYNLDLLYQKRAPQLLSIAQSWAPIPDNLAYIYNWGFLAIVSIMLNDPRFPVFNHFFISRLLALQSGLSEMQRNIFLGNWTEVMRQVQGTQAKLAQGIQARAQ